MTIVENPPIEFDIDVEEDVEKIDNYLTEQRKLEVLKKSLELLQDGKNWGVGSYYENTVNGLTYCVLGAIITSSEDVMLTEADMIDTSAFFFRKIEDLFKSVNSLHSIPRWNDNPEVTWDHVKAAFSKTIEHQSIIAAAAGYDAHPPA